MSQNDIYTGILNTHSCLVQMDISVGKISRTAHARSVSRFLSVRSDRGRESTEKLLIRFDASLWSQEGGGKDLLCCDIQPPRRRSCHSQIDPAARAVGGV